MSSELLKKSPAGRLVGVVKSAEGAIELAIDPEKHWGANESLNEAFAGLVMGAAAHRLFGNSKTVWQHQRFLREAKEGVVWSRAKLIVGLGRYALLHSKLFHDGKVIATALILRKKLK